MGESHRGPSSETLPATPPRHTSADAVGETLFATRTHELLAGADVATRAEARRASAEFVEVWSDGERRRSAFGYVSPVPYERRLGRRASAAEITPRHSGTGPVRA